MLYPELYQSLEAVRWNMHADIDWNAFDAARLSDEQAITIRMNAITEWSALPATEMFLRDNRHDSDFSAFMSIWFFEEQKHSLVLMEYLRRFRPELVPTEAELHAVRFEFDPAPPLETLMLHFCGEIRLNHWYRRAAEWHTEPVIRQVYEIISRDEARHGGAYLRYMKQALARQGDVARAAFAKLGVLMASARRTEKPLHPTNLHVNQSLFPRDTVQSRLPDPAWLERWLDEQIRFDGEWEKKVVDRILHNLSILFERPIASVQELNRYRKEVVARLPACAAMHVGDGRAEPARGATMPA
ncbi:MULTISPECIES: diiron oxygenase [unclassified Burkholderia]|uniref:diiron oxygenase n=1 Tax=unclassified Burkholderia TaxID=2613784 RepID=UPI00141EC64F|nr:MULTISPECIES: diiron oxygenase [unclassified Burkholderia]NIE85783.1 ferritin-like domain-containing protein [Burkholderia sp. Tr-860]NIF66271.1 ferritin-like domain-containing protein [Burkholderia sp. Cy-647]NIF98522.1 ferritin-like domain-containing protein [Burkholderia sp. Ax-1720]